MCACVRLNLNTEKQENIAGVQFIKQFTFKYGKVIKYPKLKKNQFHCNFTVLNTVNWFYFDHLKLIPINFNVHKLYL